MPCLCETRKCLEVFANICGDYIELPVNATEDGRYLIDIEFNGVTRRCAFYAKANNPFVVPNFFNGNYKHAVTIYSPNGDLFHCYTIKVIPASYHSPGPAAGLLLQDSDKLPASGNLKITDVILGSQSLPVNKSFDSVDDFVAYLNTTFATTYGLNGYFTLDSSGSIYYSNPENYQNAEIVALVFLNPIDVFADSDSNVLHAPGILGKEVICISMDRQNPNRENFVQNGETIELTDGGSFFTGQRVTLHFTIS